MAWSQAWLWSRAALVLWAVFMALSVGYHPSVFQMYFLAFNYGGTVLLAVSQGANNSGGLDHRMAIMLLVNGVAGAVFAAIYTYNLFYVLGSRGYDAALVCDANTVLELTAGLMWHERAIPIIVAVLIALTTVMYMIDIVVAAIVLRKSSNT